MTIFGPQDTKQTLRGHPEPAPREVTFCPAGIAWFLERGQGIFSCFGTFGLYSKLFNHPTEVEQHNMSGVLRGFIPTMEVKRMIRVKGAQKSVSAGLVLRESI